MTTVADNRSILLYGAAGTGKSLVVNALATELAYSAFFVIACSYLLFRFTDEAAT